jgi:single-stranded-DNA-specific exonuclease
LETFGGHYFAAGLTLAEEQLPAFIERFEAVVKDMVAEDLFTPELEIDADLSLQDIQAPFMRLLEQFAPHGPDNMKPVFRTRGVYDYNGYSNIVKERHLRLSISADGKTNISGIGFNLADKIGIVKSGLPFDVVYHLEENEWNNKKTIQLKIIDVQAGNEPNFDV